MTFWAYLLHCRGGAFYAGHTDDLERRVAQHEAGAFPGFSAGRLPVTLVWSENFATRIEALETERRIKGWSRAKKMALIRGDWDEISYPAKGKNDPSTGSGRTEVGGLFLCSHPAHPPGAVRSLDVTATRSAGGLALTYCLTGDIAALAIPPQAAPHCADNLWQTTCFELFLRGEGAAYREYNFSPSGEWAAYAFDSYRAGRRDIPAQIAIATNGDAESLNLTATLVTDLADVTSLALSAVIEERDGHKSFWALTHHAGPPDFHHDACFALRLADIGAP